MRILFKHIYVFLFLACLLSISKPALSNIENFDVNLDIAKSESGKENQTFILNLYISTKPDFHIEKDGFYLELNLPNNISIKPSSVNYPKTVFIYNKFLDKKIKTFNGSMLLKIYFEVPNKYFKSKILKGDLHVVYKSFSKSTSYLPKTLNLDVELSGPKTALRSNGLNNRFNQLFAMGFWFALLAAFLTGIISSLTPCVYPILPIVVSVIGSRSEGKRKKGLLLSLMFCAGLAFIYSILGVIAARSGSFLGSYLQNKIAFIVVASIFFLMSLSLLGLFEFKLPFFITRLLSKKTDQTKNRYFGTVFYGMITGIVAIPCIGPFAVGVLTVAAQSPSAFHAFILLFAFSLGLGFIFVLVGVFSTILLSLPKPGAWMVFIKQIFGLLMLIVAYYYLDYAFSKEILMLLIGLSLVLVSYTFYKASKQAGEKIASAQKTLSLVSGITAVLMIFAFSANPNIDDTNSTNTAGSDADAIRWVTSEPQAIKMAFETSKPILLDFYADWCPNCRDLDKYTFSNESVIDKTNNFIPLRIDLTKDNSELTRIANKYKVQGLPTILILDKRGRELKNLRTTGYVRAKTLLRTLNKALK